MCICVQSLSYRSNQLKLLSEVSLTLVPGKINAIIGPGSEDKPALLKCMSGELEPSAGQILWDDIPLNQWSIRERLKKRSTLPSNDFVQPNMTIREFIKSNWKDGDHHFAKRLDVLFELCHIFDLSKLLDKNLCQLSTSELRRVRFMQALLNSHFKASQFSPFLLLSESTSSLDYLQEIKLLNHLRELEKTGATIVITLTDLNLAARYCNHLILLDGGRLIASGSAESVLESKLLSEVYHHPISVTYHQNLQRLFVHH